MNLTKTINEQIAAAATVIKQGGVVAYPTETYYGLAVDPFNHNALQRLFDLKQRPAAKPILTLIADTPQLACLAEYIPPLFEPLMTRYWPGPLTLVFPAQPTISSLLTAGTGTVGARISSNPVAQALVKLVASPITATSANISGKSAALSLADLNEQFGIKLDLVVDAGSTPGGVGSTVVGYDHNALVVLRQGAVSL